VQSVEEREFWAPKIWGLTADRLRASDSRMIVVSRGTFKRARDMASCDVGSKKKSPIMPQEKSRKESLPENSISWEQKDQ
jgi:hypothetical protein